MTKKKLILVFILVLAAGVVFWGINLTRHTIHLYQARQEVKMMLLGGLESVSPNYAFQLLNEVEQDLSVIDRSLGWSYPLLNVTGKLTSQVQPSIKYLKSLTRYTLLFEEKLAPFMNREMDSGVELTSLINDILSDEALIAQAKFYSEEIERQHARIEISALPFRFQDDFQMLEPFIPAIISSGKIFPLLPDLAGMNAPAQYLLLALNHDELRGGGGFITAMGTATLNSLIDIDFEMQDSYQVDDLTKAYPLPPQPLQDYMLAGIWVPRDGNWSADFPTSAQTVQNLYELSTAQKTNAVIAFDQHTVQKFLEVMGPINIDPSQELWVNSDNVLEYMYESWGQASDSENWWANRKDFVGILGKAMLQSLINTRDYKKMIALAKVSHELLQSGHLMLYFNEPAIQSLLAEMDLDAAVQYQGGDFLYWVDSNIGFNKVDAVIIRKLTYAVDLTDLDNPTAHLTMEYEHPIDVEVPCVHEATYGKDIAYTNMFQRCYWDYWRVYTAPSTKLLNANVQSVPGDLLLSGNDWLGDLDLESDLPGLGMIAGLQIVPTNATRQIVLNLALSPEILTYQSGVIGYQLTLHKQLGLTELPILIKIKIPNNYKFYETPNFYINNNLGNVSIRINKNIEKLYFAFYR
ncbi:MAG: hypothetical protein CVU40_09925 [Chloroflexi bacterium HGW-Chloroflexi-2]|jgi:hypothetical protein|nr:MAG: hypothetical protein CVU40_09925 [Chloroflexi bacterium HGW-Chloroflexi-2]